MNKKLDLDHDLEPYATERQWELLKAWEHYGTQAKAGKALGVHKSRFTAVLIDVRVKAARRGHSPDNPNYHGNQVPPGFTLRGQSAKVDGNNALMERWDKTRMEGMDPERRVQLPDPKTLTKISTMVDAEGRVITQHFSEAPDDVAREEAWRLFMDELVARLESAPALPPVPEPRVLSGENVMVGYPVGDHHLGMLSWAAETGDDYDLDIGRNLLVGAFGYLTERAQDADSALIGFLGDFFHYDNFVTQTPKNRNDLDSDTRFPKLVDVGFECMTDAIRLALAKHRWVKVIVTTGNHDPVSTVFLRKCLSLQFRDEPRVEIDTLPRACHYHRFGRVLIGCHHGHSIAMQNLPLTMATDRKEDWGETDHRHFWTGHIHKSKKQPMVSADDHSGCVVEAFRVLCPPDAWASEQGYRQFRDMHSITYHAEDGEMSRTRVSPAMIQKYT